MFFNELDVLEIRLQEMWDIVDYFVISEANIGHSGKPKEYIFENNKDRFEKYMSKIRHIKVDDFPPAREAIERDRYQRYCIHRGLTDIEPEDIIIVSDLDEIPRAEAVQAVIDDENNYERYIFTIPMFQYKINYMKYYDINKQPNIMVTRGRVFTNPQQEREYSFFWNPKPENTVEVDHGGWHFTYFGDNDHCVNKIKNFAHTEHNVPCIVDEFNIDWMIQNKYGSEGPDNTERFEYVVVNEYFPKCITDNLDRWQNMIIPNAVFHVTDLYRETDRN
jgi:hypothetical protein